MQQAPQLDRQRRARIRELEKEVTMFAIGHLIESTRAPLGGGFPASSFRFARWVHTSTLDHVSSRNARREA